MTRIKYKIIFFSILMVPVIGGGVYLYHLSQYWKQQIAAYTTKEIMHHARKLNIQLEWEQLDISFILPKITLKKISLKPSAEPAIEGPVLIRKILITPDYLATLRSKTLFPKVTIIKPTLKINLGTNSFFSKKSAVSKKLSPPPIHIVLKNMALFLKNTGRELSIYSMDAHLYSHASYSTVYLKTPTILLQNRPPFSLEVDMTWQNHQLKVKQFTLKNIHSHLHVMGEIHSLFQGRQKSWLKIHSTLKAEDFMAFSGWLDKPARHPFWQGEVRLVAHLGYHQKKPFPKGIAFHNIKGDFSVSTRHFAIQDIFLSEIHAQGKILNQQVQFNTFQIKHFTDWRIQLLHTKMDLKKPFSFKTDIQIQNSNLHSLLQAGNLKRASVFSKVSGRWQCQGRWRQAAFLDCKGTADFNNLMVQNHTGWRIFKMPVLNTKNAFQITPGIFKVQVKGSAPSSVMDFSGQYTAGKSFAAQMKGKVDFSDMEDLVNLSPQGTVTIKNGKMGFSQKTGFWGRAWLQVKKGVLKNIQIGQAPGGFKLFKGDAPVSRYQRTYQAICLSG